jgi:hypothetical protein
MKGLPILFIFLFKALLSIYQRKRRMGSVGVAVKAAILSFIVRQQVEMVEDDEEQGEEEEEEEKEEEEEEE